MALPNAGVGSAPVPDAKAAKAVRAPKTAQVVADALRREIVRGEIAEGEPLPSEQEMMLRFGVSRPSLREALRILESENLIVVRRGARGGARATRPDISVAANYVGLIMQSRGVRLADVFEARVWIEPLAARILAERPDRAAAVARLREIARRESEVADDRVLYSQTTAQFHQALVDLSGNRTLALLWGTLQRVLSSEISDSSSGPTVNMKAFALRQRVLSEFLDLVENGDAAAAQTLWRERMAEARQMVVRLHGSKTLVDVMS